MQQNITKKILNSRWLLYFLLLLIIWLTISLTRVFYKKYQLNNEIMNLKNEISKLEKNDQELKELISLFSDKNFLEKEAKAKLNFKREGEKVFIVPPAEEMPRTASSSSSSFESLPVNSSRSGNFLKWWQYFFSQ